MHSCDDPLTAIASPPPTLPARRVGNLVAAEYGLHGELTALVSERDQNFRLTTRAGQRYVVKIANAAEAAAVTDCQVQALLHIERVGCAVAVPRVVPTRAGATTTRITAGEAEHCLRVVNYLPGRPLGEASPDTALARQLGRCLATIDVALEGFTHPGENQPLLWDMQRADRLRELVPHIRDAALQGRVRRCLDDFLERVAPQFPGLRSQVIHNDLNPDNVLVADDGAESVAGVIDFGDMVRAPLIVDVAVAASYLRADDPDVTAPLAGFVAGYTEVSTLADKELLLLQDLIRTRLATTVTILHWRLSTRDEGDAYATKSLQIEGGAGRFLERIDVRPRAEFNDRLLAAAGR